MPNFKPYLSLARIDNWSKNLVVGAGAGAACVLAELPVAWINVALAVLALCFASSANYVINEYVDAGFDRFHPLKQKRAAVRYVLDARIVVAEYALLAAAALLVAWQAQAALLPIIGFYLVAAWAYNLRPVRLKDIPYADVLTESVNYPVRILAGWLAIAPQAFPSSSLVIIAWAFGAFTMSVKRLAELKLFGNAAKAAAYRKSYAYYTPDRLMMLSFIFAMSAIFGLSVFLVKYRIEFVLLMPFVIAWFTQYLAAGLAKSEHAIYPERMVKNVPLMALTLSICIGAIWLARAHLPWLEALRAPAHFTPLP